MGNDKISKDILVFLMPKMKSEDYKLYFKNSDEGQHWFKEMEEALNNPFQKYWYRYEGSRKNFSNEHPSFWAITQFTDPWSFKKNDQPEYETFKNNVLRQLENHSGIPQKAFYADWKHLLDSEPTKDMPLAKKTDPKKEREFNQREDDLLSRQQNHCKKTELLLELVKIRAPYIDEDDSPKTPSREEHMHGKRTSKVLWKKLLDVVPGYQANMLSIFPHPLDESFGLKKLMQNVGIEKTDLQLEALEKRDFIK